ncbi:ThuA domain-containing protein [Dyadobacter chenhuakuii]|uniref:ThuA domain-containing protein n=1 Tax=Dyadobacter chenhuakuii TaxID=2909339 RepID=A0ABY4XSS5_9BACT|nr:ThuA domain-containing protein [Dyadobacter chenhuakuii]MCF2492247.1 ThuA domain-containing protein [Dyadobacter chenhuakuii]USJ33445.1 ThuA domain-containing protein [Dyadobacter chenhuakuii]
MSNFLNQILPKQLRKIGIVAMACFCVNATAQTVTPEKRVLVFSKTAGFRHASIPAGRTALIKLGKEKGFAVDTTENSSVFNEKNLQKYSAVVFLNTTGDILNDKQQDAFERYIQAGGGYLGIHASTDTEYEWPWYNKLAGAQFLSHPGNPNVQEGEAYVVNDKHESMTDFPKKWKIKDEFYDFKNFNPKVNVLVKIDEKSYKDGKMGDDHPMSWYHEYDGGKAFYTNFGHEDATFVNPVFVKHLTGGLNYVMASKLDYSKSRPEENRFTKKVLATKLDEPTELVVLDDQRVLLSERKGKLKLYNPKTGKIKVVADVPVYIKQEYGLMGLNIDPNFKTNKLVYLYYSPPSTEKDTAQHLSRFKYDDVKDTLLLSTEEVLLTVPVKRNDCCHTGGSIAWDAKGNLYLSTGDDVNPFQSNGYGPIDGRPGREGWDGRHTSSNTNSLRGKVLRIKPRYGDRRANMPGGTNLYDIPEGNLFPPGDPKARPEIYVMGTRNPYRISVDQHTGYLYWGDVGPDASNDDPKRGPRGYDEVNQARKAGYFGYPLFIADNKPYVEFNFADSTSGKPFDPAKPINNSPHNTGLQELPPAQPAYIYYPYADSPDFGAIVGKGGRNAMAGPVYYAADFQDSKSKFPGYYSGKFFSYDWIRDYINVVTMNEQGDLQNIERFLPNTKFSHPIDMQFANDGSLYTLEYGPNWFAQNDEASLSHITYNAGNRVPVALATATNTVGAVPLKVNFSSKGSIDHDGDAVKYEWTFGKGFPKSTVANPSFTYAKPGEYIAILKVTDSAGNSNTSEVTVKAGNAIPKVDVAIKGNKTFYWNDKPVNYEVSVADKEDGSLADKKIPEDEVTLTINYLEGFDKTQLAQGHVANTGFETGKRLIELSDCKACHSIDKKSIGPAYIEVAKRYEKERNSVKTLADKVIRGGGGVWGEQAMAAHPQHKPEEAEEMVKYILSLAKEKVVDKKPLKSSYVTEAKKKDGSYIFTASYTDKGSAAMGPLTGSKTIALRPATLLANAADSTSNIFKFKNEKSGEMVIGTKNGSFITFDDIDLSGISNLSVAVTSVAERTAGGILEIHLDGVAGPKVGEGKVDKAETINIAIKAPADNKMHKLFFVFRNSSAGPKPLFGIEWIKFDSAAM